MDRPAAPRRKSSADGKDDESRTKGHRKTFVVGTKNHHRVPSYGKKLNQLSKLTSLTTTTTTNGNGETKVAGPDTTVSNSPRRATIQRTASQKSLSDARHSRRNGSTQDLRKLKRSSSHHGSSAKLTALKPMTKLEDVTNAGKNSETESYVSADEEDTQPPQASKTLPNKRATFVIEDEDEDEEAEDVASSFANKAFLYEKRNPDKAQKNSVPAPSTSLLSPRTKVGVPNLLSSDRTAGQGEVSSRKENEGLKRDAPVTTNTTPDGENTTPSRKGSTSGLLYHPTTKPVGPMLTTESAVSKDIQIKERPTTNRSVTMLTSTSTPVNSQPLTSRFLESPHASSFSRTVMQHVNSSKENILPNSTANAGSSLKPTKHAAFYNHSPHGSTTNLGAGSSRTQQKLMLQRASSIYFDAPDPDNAQANDMTNIQRAQKEIDRISREYKNVKRFRNPSKDLAHRCYARGLAVPKAPAAAAAATQPLRRTMTQIGLSSGPAANASSTAAGAGAGAGAAATTTPKTSQSTVNLKQGGSSVSRSQESAGSLRPFGPEVERLLTSLWRLDDHEVETEE